MKIKKITNEWRNFGVSGTLWEISPTGVLPSLILIDASELSAHFMTQGKNKELSQKIGFISAPNLEPIDSKKYYVSYSIVLFCSSCNERTRVSIVLVARRAAENPLCSCSVHHRAFTLRAQ